MHTITDKKFYLGPKFGTLFIKKWIKISELLQAACSMFHGKAIRPLGCSHRGELIGERAASEGGPPSLTIWWRSQGCSRRGELIGERVASEGGPPGLTIWWHGQGLGCATLWWAWPLAPLSLIFGLREASVKIGGSAFVSSNSENLKHKNSRKQGTGTMASC
jgi:hypothetical protein